jgi:heme/copper-type cytochrome/quinol oxidase subunit 2
MIEWQNESSLFTVRIHGKQWYWVYKFDLKNMVDIASAPKNVGRNRWMFVAGNELSVHDSYIQAVQSRNKFSWAIDYWVSAEKKDIKPASTVDLLTSPELGPDLSEFVISPDHSAEVANNIANNVTNNSLQATIDYFVAEEPSPDFENNQQLLQHAVFRKDTFKKTFKNLKNRASWLISQVAEPLWLVTPSSLSATHSPAAIAPHYESLPLDDLWDVEHSLRKFKATGPARIIRPILTPEYIKTDYDTLKIRFFDSNGTSEKVEDNSENYWILKQKRYKKKQDIHPSKYYDTDFYDMRVYTAADKKPELKTFRYLVNATISDNLYTFKLHGKTDQKIMTSFSFYQCVRNNKKRGELLPVTLSRRLLRTKKTLVLPAHVNMTLVTNSYDVVHSWFVPGLGIKIDCVPGRSTHHSFYIDNVGFYYGQCAEICGRYHHHMPIRICALPFEHFLVWWRAKGLPKLLKVKLTDPVKSAERLDNTLYAHELVNYSNLKYYW